MEIEIPLPKSDEVLFTARDITYGEQIAPLSRLKILDADRWEDFTLELVYYWKTQYVKVVRCGGGGDMGRDVIAYSNLPSGEWENFQCKHYSSKLNVAQALLEIGKLLYYAYKGELTVPVKYYFVTPLGISTDLLNHLRNSEKLKSALLNRWNDECRSKITSKRDNNIELTDDLQNFIKSVNFHIFDHIPPMEILDLHSNTPFHVTLFGSQIKRRPKIPIPPSNLADNEIIYTSELLRAFSDAEGEKLDTYSLSNNDDYKDEYESARKNFYAAEDLERFSRDWLPDNSYQELIDECYEVISPTIKKKFENGYERYLSTTEQASIANYSSHPLKDYIKTQDKKGICHQLVNESRIKWVRGKPHG
ncbi:ABC-three component system protein [Thiothrix fructosivorans]|uniref:ABC-three component systems C-terminal domain-containing protein n=1 Tax=Thiothrix fructosivorans TaxID=111770 RepID=A0A8B0SMK7_9GAMM|nr:ABC-three component system protein [Thiothrix fructosivorans]MBO0612789.1 hypothetical protein [Thiothrix fructosivorans]QTX11750.1 hypothetical protein J1836_005230 [Thiothrix fructosivorans]